MTDILHDLRLCDLRGVVPPQDWTTRAADEIERLRAALAAPAAVPVAWLYTLKGKAVASTAYVPGVRAQPLVLAGAKRALQPMSAEQIDRHIGPDEGDREAVTAIVREVETWHSITDAPAAPSVPQWQPIETAPKTGRKIIVAYTNRNAKPRTVMARWLTDEQAAETDSDGVGLEGGWYECIDNWDDYTEVAIHEGEPTHWMPLPAAPTDGGQGHG